MTAEVGARAAGALAGLAIDRTFGEPPNAIHPLIAVGHGLTWLESRLYADNRRSGVAHLSVAIATGAGVGVALRCAIGAGPATALATAIATGSRMLGEVANEVGDALVADDLAGAREALRSLAGRDASSLDEPEIARAVIESVAENTVDATTATLFWAVIGGAPLVIVHRVTNTLDAMIGHHNDRYEHFGWAAARLDDALNWAPARLTAFAIAATRPTRFREIVDVVRRDGPQHPSPNGGRVEAAMAAAMQIRLGGTNRYGDRVEHRGVLGDGRAPTGTDIATAVRTADVATAIVAALAATAATTSWFK